MGSEKPSKAELNDHFKTVVVPQLYELGIQKLEDELDRLRSKHVILTLHTYVHNMVDMCISTVYVINRAATNI